MPTHIWTVLCRKGIIDSENNNITLSDVIEKINIEFKKTPESPQVSEGGGIFFPFEHELVSLFQVKPNDDFDILVDFLDPLQSVINSQAYAVKVQAGNTRIRNKLKIPGLPVKESGIYAYRVGIKEKGSGKAQIVAEIPLEIEVKIG